MLLTVDEAREAVTTSLSDDRLLELLTAAEADITAAAGPVASQTEHVGGGYAGLVLARPVGTVTTVTEYADTATELDLEPDDYRVDGHILRRLETGTNPARWWRGLVRVTHAPDERIAERKRAQIALVSVEITIATGVTSEKVGDWSASYGQNTRGATIAEQREAALAPLRPVLV